MKELYLRITITYTDLDMSKIEKILIANRGEIALRIMKTVRSMGLTSVAVYSDADKAALHVQYADDKVYIGASPSSESYLVMNKIIEAAKQTNADAIHPGYGFLSENADFARLCEKNNITFIGPGTYAIEAMGSKIAAKQLAKENDVPLVPGLDEPIEDVQQAKRIAKEIGYPILIKASAGGGGKGMRIVENEQEFEDQMQRAVSEAISSFGDGAVFIEKFVKKPRHIEIQVLADKHGNTVHLFERECSIQRRHQKVIEEAPSSVLDDALRTQMGNCAISIARACNYVGAGTVEFLLDEDKNFYFLEMNTRLQVEHPVTEMITSVDLVEQQIRVAQGEKLAFKQEDLKIDGHAIEVRVYAEDPLNNFLPDIGQIEYYQEPIGKGIRVDTGFTSGMQIPIYYDPMIAKLSCHDKTRAKAIEKTKKALEDYKISGFETTIDFAHFVMRHKAFKSGDFDTNFVAKYFEGDYDLPLSQDESELASLFAVYNHSSDSIVRSKAKLSSQWKLKRSS